MSCFFHSKTTLVHFTHVIYVDTVISFLLLFNVSIAEIYTIYSFFSSWTFDEFLVFCHDEKCLYMPLVFIFYFYLFFFAFCFFRAAPAAYGGSQAWGPIRTVAAGLHQSHSNARSESRLQSASQLTTTPDP